MSKLKKKVNQENFSSIVALVYVSESELVKAFPGYSAEWETTQPGLFSQILYSFGLNTAQPYHRQDAIQHRNKLNEIVTCSRWVGNERHDDEWIALGFASREALDRHKNNRLLDDSYRMRGMTQDVQDTLEQRDKYYESEEE